MATGRRKGWEALSDSYRSRLLRTGINQSRYEAGESLHKARGHKSREHESTLRIRRRDDTATKYRRRIERYAETTAEFYTNLPPQEIVSELLAIGPEEGNQILDEQAAAQYEYDTQGHSRKGQNRWNTRENRYSDYLYYYHGMF